MSSVQSVPTIEFPDWSQRTMQGKAKERWVQLCEQAAMEQDTERLIDLVEEINRMLDEKEQRLECEQSERGVGI
jgi:hypothetical protein